MYVAAMKTKLKPGLGELLRYIGELVEQGAEEQYREMGLSYRARYTPLLRAISAGAETVTDIKNCTHLTQGAVSQSVGLMVDDGILERRGMEDGRKSGVFLTHKGEELMKELVLHWEIRFAAIDDLEREIGYPLMKILEDTAAALEQKDFSSRLAVAMRRRQSAE